MNPMTNIKNVIKLSEQELRTSNKTSWHDQYRDSAWLFIGGLPYDLTEGDIICMFSQYGEIITINLIRDKDTGKQKGFCFLCYEDQRSTDLAVDNLNGIKEIIFSVLGRTIRVDHVANYKVPKESREKVAQIKKTEGDEEPIIKKEDIKSEQQPTSTQTHLNANNTTDDIQLPPRLPIYPIKKEETSMKSKKVKKEKKRKKKDKKKHTKNRSSSNEDASSDSDEHKKRRRKNS